MEKTLENRVNVNFIHVVHCVHVTLWVFSGHAERNCSAEVNEEEGLVLQARPQPVLREVPLPWQGRLLGLFCHVGVSIVMGIPKNGGFLLGEIPSRNG